MRICLVMLMFLAGCEADKVDASMGARCTMDTDCAQRCLAPGPAFPGGMCTFGCGSDRQCPSDASCIARMGGVCLYDCRDDGDCAFLGNVGGIGWTCQDAPGLSDALDAGADGADAGTGKKVCLGAGQ